MDRLSEKYGEEEARRMRKEWGKKGGLTGGNGLQSLTSEDKSQAGKAGRKAVIEKYSVEQRKEWSRKGANKRWVDSLSTPKGEK